MNIYQTTNLTPEPDQPETSKVYRISLPYKVVKTQRENSMYHEYVRVRDNETIDQVILSVKETMFYDFVNAPLIEGVHYHLHIENAPY
jgi:hypothetical protein